MLPIQQNQSIFHSILNEDSILNIFKKIDVKDLYPISLVCQLFFQHVSKLRESPAIKQSFLYESINDLQLTTGNFAGNFALEKQVKYVVNETKLFKVLEIYTIEELEKAQEFSIEIKKILGDNEISDQVKMQKMTEMQSVFNQTSIGRSCKQKEQMNIGLMQDLIQDVMNNFIQDLARSLRHDQ